MFSSLWHNSSAMEDTEVDYISLPYVPMSPTSAPPVPSFANIEHPEICVTNVTGDQIKFVFGGNVGNVPSANSNNETLDPEASEPMDHS